MSLAHRASNVARQIIADIRREITQGEHQLRELRDAHERWSRIVQGDGKRGPVRAEARKGPAVDWDKVLKSLPPRFSSELIEKRTPELQGFPLSRNSAIARWVRFGAVKKVGEGKYAKRKVKR